MSLEMFLNATHCNMLIVTFQREDVEGRFNDNEGNLMKFGRGSNARLNYISNTVEE